MFINQYPVSSTMGIFTAVSYDNSRIKGSQRMFFFTAASKLRTEYTDISYIGHGTAGVVIKATYLSDHRVYAIKVLKTER